MVVIRDHCVANRFNMCHDGDNCGSQHEVRQVYGYKNNIQTGWRRAGPLARRFVGCAVCCEPARSQFMTRLKAHVLRLT